jgi:hypothetical protein
MRAGVIFRGLAMIRGDSDGGPTPIATNDTRISGMAMYNAGSLYASINAATGSNSGAILYQIQPFVTARGANDGQIAGARILDELVHNGAGDFDAYYATQQPDPESNVTYVWSKGTFSALSPNTSSSETLAHRDGVFLCVVAGCRMG